MRLGGGSMCSVSVKKGPRKHDGNEKPLPLCWSQHHGEEKERAAYLMLNIFGLI